MTNPNKDLSEVIGRNPHWRDDAVCSSDPESWFPEPGSHSLCEREICLTECTVAPQCLASAFQTGERFGIWGGLTVSALRKAHKERARAIRAGNPPKPVELYLSVASAELEKRTEDVWDQTDVDLHNWSRGLE